MANTGAELPPDAVGRLTQPFERLGRRAGGRGAGLGLSIVEAVTAAHGGRLHFALREGGGLDVEVVLARRAVAGTPALPRAL